MLASCFFLPAVRGCGGDPVHPYDVPGFTSPYAIGLLIALFAILALILRERVPVAISRIHTAICCLGVLATAVYFAFGTVAEILDGWNGWARLVPLAAPLAGCLALAALASLALRRNRSQGWREARATWTFGAATFLWLLQWALDRYSLMFGWWLSVIASLMVVAGGALLERASRLSSGKLLND